MLQTRSSVLSVAEFERLGAEGALAEDARVELIDGTVVEMNPIGPLHAGCVAGLTTLFAPLAIAGRAILWVQNPLALTDASAPAGTERYPDVALLRPVGGRYRATPTAEAALLVVEVADATLADDLGDKLPRYARATIPEVWLVDLRGERVLVFQDPAEGQYRVVRELHRGGAATPLAFPDCTVPVSDILG